MINLSTRFQDFDYAQFCKDFLPEDLYLYKEDLIKQPYQKYITASHVLGTVKSLNLSILEFQQTSEHDPRVSLAKEAFRIMADHRIRRGLVIFWNPQTKNWRLSLMTINLDIDERNKIIRNYSNAKRFSFLLGEGEAMKTPRTQLEKRVKDFEDLQKRFSVEVVRKEFFDDYIDLFIRLYIEISKDESFIKVLLDQGIDRVKFTKNLLGKIIFVYFVQKKGWLGLGRDEVWGKGDQNFMRSLWNRFASGDTFVRPSTEYFYNDYLEHLFYNGFNKDRRDDDAYEPNMKMKVPYLNGGLFKEDYRDWEHFVAKISNDIFSNGKDGILDVFDTYNFTIDEDDLTDAEIAVDPEMLGKIFEKMISVSKDNIDEIVSLYKEKGKVKIGTELNKKFGAFYTPREIVHYMTRESLLAYLSTNIVGKREESEIKIRQLIDAKDQHLSKAEVIQLFGGSIDTVLAFAHEIDTYLQKVKIIDPAVGSGAFPMGILHEITTLRYYLHSEGFCTIHHTETEDDSEELTENGHISLYQIKRETIKNSIYGVDIEPGAIDIARLRFWLSLVVDAENPEPLPNFEFKFVCANTLIPLAEEIEKNQTALDLGQNELNLKTLRKYMTEYYNADNKTKKKQLEDRINSYVALDGSSTNAQTTFIELSTPRRLQLSNFHPFNSNHSNPFFDPSLMMGEGRGFDIVIGNPPYKFLSGKGSPIKELEKKGKKQEAEQLQEQLNLLSGIYSKSSQGCKDFYKWFIEKGLLLARKKGILCYITPNTFISLSKYLDVRKLLFEENGTDILLDLGFDIFEDPVVPTTIFITKRFLQNISFFHYSDLKDLSYSDITGCDLERIRKERILEVSISEGSLKIYKNYIAERIYENPDFIPLVKILKIKEGDHCSIPDFGKIYNSSSAKTPFINDSMLARYSYVPIVYLESSEYTTIPSFHTGERIILRKTGDSILASLPENFSSGITHQNSYVCKMISEDNVKFIYLLLCSKFLNFLYQNGPYGQKGRTLAQFRVYGLNLLPIKVPENQSNFITIIDQILEIKKHDSKGDISTLEEKIDDLVYELYGLTEEEIKIVEGN